MSDFEGVGFISSLIDSFEKGLDIDEFSQVTGESDYGKLDYPIAQFYPDQSNYDGSQVYRDTHTIFFIFEQNVDESQIKHNSMLVEKALDSLGSELGKNDLVKEWKPENIRYLIGENQDNLLDVVQVDYRVTKVVGFQ